MGAELSFADPLPAFGDPDDSELFTPAQVVPVAPHGNSGRRKFDTTAHPAWAVDYICELVSANNGSALVLSATTSARKFYASELRERCPGITVHSQWDGLGIRQIVDWWREDTGSVLIGTRSLMTGVAAPGGTCSLVIIDRVPRSPSNPVDDARAASIAKRLEICQRQAEQVVYVADAALLMERKYSVIP